MRARAAIDSDEREVAQQVRWRDGLDRRHADTGRLDQQIIELRERIAGIRSRRPDRAAVLLDLTERFAELLAAFAFPKLDEPEPPYLNDKFVPYVRGNRYTDIGSTGALTLISLAWELAIFERSIEQGNPHPGFLMIDSPQKNLKPETGAAAGDEFVDGAIPRRVWEHIVGWTAGTGKLGADHRCRQPPTRHRRRPCRRPVLRASQRSALRAHRGRDRLIRGSQRAARRRHQRARGSQQSPAGQHASPRVDAVNRHLDTVQRPGTVGDLEIGPPPAIPLTVPACGNDPRHICRCAQTSSVVHACRGCGEVGEQRELWCVGDRVLHLLAANARCRRLALQRVLQVVCLDVERVAADDARRGSLRSSATVLRRSHLIETTLDLPPPTLSAAHVIGQLQRRLVSSPSSVTRNVSPPIVPCGVCLARLLKRSRSISWGF